MKYRLFFIILFSSTAFSQTWNISEKIFTKENHGIYDTIAVKDPSIVYYENQWHLFYTTLGIGYAKAPTLQEFKHARHMHVDSARGIRSLYAVSPQVFYFEPQKLWYLIYHTRDAYYQPMFSTTKTIDQPLSWSGPSLLVEKTDTAKWIDFWVICDDSSAYLYYTRAHKDVYVMTTNITDFPKGFSQPSKIFSGVHESSHVYKVKGKQEYDMIYELRTDNIRSFGMAVAQHPLGPWNRISDEYATGAQLQFPNGVERWTDQISQGEIIRTGNDQWLEYDPQETRIIIQGMLKSEQGTLPYGLYPWNLGIITKVQK